MSDAVRRRPPADLPPGRFAARRTPPPRRTRRRWFLVPLAAAALLTAGGWWLVQQGAFRVETIATGGYRFTPADSLEAALRPLLGRDLWAVDREAMTAALAGFPWIRDIAVHRRLPDAVQVEFSEWRPVLYSPPPAGHGGDWLLVEDGRVLALPSSLPAPDLPVLDGVAPPRRGEDGAWRLAPDVSADVLEVLAGIRDAGVEEAGAVDFVVARPQGWGIVLREGQVRLLLGREDFAARLHRYMAGRDQVPVGREIDLRFHELITVRQPGP